MNKFVVLVVEDDKLILNLMTTTLGIHNVLQREQKSDGFQAESGPWARPVPVHHPCPRM